MGSKQTRMAWWPDTSDATECTGCGEKFGWFRHKKICWDCGFAHCWQCTQYRCEIPSRGVHFLVPVCGSCFVQPFLERTAPQSAGGVQLGLLGFLALLQQVLGNPTRSAEESSVSLTSVPDVDGNDVCAICQHAFVNTLTDANDEDAHVVGLPCCTHRFHRGCIVPWLQHNPTCPIDRRPIRPAQGQ